MTPAKALLTSSLWLHQDPELSRRASPLECVQARTSAAEETAAPANRHARRKTFRRRNNGANCAYALHESATLGRIGNTIYMSQTSLYTCVMRLCLKATTADNAEVTCVCPHVSPLILNILLNLASMSTTQDIDLIYYCF
jgi:hypothetical protein